MRKEKAQSLARLKKHLDKVRELHSRKLPSANVTRCVNTRFIIPTRALSHPPSDRQNFLSYWRVTWTGRVLKRPADFQKLKSKNYEIVDKSKRSFQSIPETRKSCFRNDVVSSFSPEPKMRAHSDVRLSRHL